MTEPEASPNPQNAHPPERRVTLPRGTADRFPEVAHRLRSLEHALLREFGRAGYQPLSTPVLEFSELHERKSGAAIVSRLTELADDREGRLCLRPELTAGVVRAFAGAERTPELPWRVCVAGPVFRSGTVRPGIDRQFTQAGVEHLGGPGPVADAEVIALADRAVRNLGLPAPGVRIGHVGLILEMLERSGLPRAAQSSLVEILSEAATDGRDIRAVDRLLERLAHWLGGESPGENPTRHGDRGATDPEIARLFDHLVPDVAGRRTGPEIMERIYRKWHLARSLRDALQQIQTQVEAIAQLRGSALDVLDRLESQYGTIVPATVAELRLLIALLGESGTPASRIELDLGFSRGIGFYSQMIFELTVATPEGPVEIGGGGRYDGLARVLGSDRDDRGVGFAFGVERLDQVLQALNHPRAPDPESQGGCLVIAAAAQVAEAASLLADLRRIATGAWEDEGPIVGPEILDSLDPPAIDAALRRAEKQGRATLIVVTGRRIDPQRVRWFRRGAGGWIEEPARPAILLATLENARRAGGLA